MAQDSTSCSYLIIYVKFNLEEISALYSYWSLEISAITIKLEFFALAAESMN